uniref:Opsin n=1 Tax=Cladonema radiatum TaxID=264074 RepID=A9CR32_9CNID|nr:opsin [Cladonema radiatum]
MDELTGTLVFLFLLVGIILNLLVIATVLKKKNRKVKDVLIISLACAMISEICFGFVWEGYGRYIDDTSLELCKMAGFGSAFSAFVSILHLIAMALERYISIVHPLKAYQHFENHMLAMYMVVPAWVIGLAWALFPFFGWGVYLREEVHTYRCSAIGFIKPSNSQSYSYGLLIFFFFLPSIIIIYLCVRVQMELIKTRKNTAEKFQGATMMVADSKKCEKQHFVLVCFIIITYFLTWTPYALSACWYTFFDSKPDHVVSYSAIFAKSGLVTNPIIYVFFYREFRETLITKVFKRKAPSPSNPSTSVEMKTRSTTNN